MKVFIFKIFVVILFFGVGLCFVFGKSIGLMLTGIIAIIGIPFSILLINMLFGLDAWDDLI